MAQHVVFLWKVEAYDAAAVAARVGESIDELGLRPQGRVLVKPNCVIAQPELFPHAFTRAEVLDGVLQALNERRTDDVSELVVGERCGITIPTRYVFAEAGYLPVLRRHGVKPIYFDECAQVEVPLHHPGRLRDSIYLPDAVARADFMVNVPKLKTHPWTTLTLALKNYVGIQDDAHRLIDHDHRLDEKICDLNFTVPQRLIVIDGITAGLGRMLTPKPVDLGMLVVGTNPVATDAVVSHIAGFDPRSIEHIRFAHEAGLGSIALEDIEIRGDLAMDRAIDHARAQGFHAERERVGAFFENTNIRAMAGPPPEPERTDYCWGGCPGAAEEAMDIIRNLQPDAGSETRPLLLLYGDLRGRDIPLRPNERVVVFGDCAQLDGKLGERPVKIESTYVERLHRRIHKARAGGIVTKIVVSILAALRGIGKPNMRFHGCPTSVAEQVLALSMRGKLRNPYLDPRITVSFTRHWMAHVVVKTYRRLIGGLRWYRMPHPAGLYPAVDAAEKRAAAAATVARETGRRDTA